MHNSCWECAVFSRHFSSAGKEIFMVSKAFRYLGISIYLPHNYNNYLKMPKEKNIYIGRDGEEA